MNKINFGNSIELILDNGNHTVRYFEGTYQGEIMNNCREGFGRFFNKEFNYVGKWRNDLPNGVGTLKCLNKENGLDKLSSYHGDWKDGKLHGNGKIIYVTGEYYIGSIDCNKKHGNGKMFNEHGQLTFDCEWENDIPLGKIKITKFWDNGNIMFEGSLDIDGLETDYGSSYNIDGTILYRGNFLEGKYNGSGKLYYGKKNDKGENIIKFDGEFNQGKYHGKGIEYSFMGHIMKDGLWNNGKFYGDNVTYNYDTGTPYYVGKMINEKKEGKGYLYYCSGNKKYDGEFSDDKFIKGIYYEDDISIDNNIIYEGSFVNEKYHGNGKQYKSVNVNGVPFNYLCYEGDFINGKFHGNGKLFDYIDNKHTLQYEGDFMDGKFHGIGTSYNNDGSKKYIGGFTDNKFNGVGIKYNENGFIEYEGEWSYDKREGKGISFFTINGYIEYIGDWHENTKHGHGELYDPDGTLVFTGNFEYGNLN